MTLDRVSIYQDGRRIGTVPNTFDLRRIQSRTMLYVPNAGDFVWQGGRWEANPNMGPGDFEAIPGFQWGNKEPEFSRINLYEPEVPAKVPSVVIGEAYVSQELIERFQYRTGRTFQLTLVEPRGPLTPGGDSISAEVTLTTILCEAVEVHQFGRDTWRVVVSSVEDCAKVETCEGEWRG